MSEKFEDSMAWGKPENWRLLDEERLESEISGTKEKIAELQKQLDQDEKALAEVKKGIEDEGPGKKGDQ